MVQELKRLVDALSFTGTKVMVTGAGSGIGRAICTRFDEAGARLVMVDSDRQGLDRTLASLSNTEHELQVVELENKYDIDALWARFEKDTLPDVLVNNAGIYPMKGFLEVDESYLRRTLDITSIRRSGCASTSSGNAPHKAESSKAGVLALTRSLATLAARDSAPTR